MIGPTCCANGIRGYGSPGKILFIGIAPGRREVEEGRPLVGPSGQLLNAILAAHGLSRDDDTYATNLICWYNDTPSPEDIAICSSRLQKEIALVNPRVIVALGTLACQNLFGLKLGRARGAVIKLRDYTYTESYGLATWHPAACLHTDNKELQIQASYDLTRDIGKLPAILQGDYDQWQEPTYTLISDVQSAQQLLDSLPKDKPVALDIETNYDKEADKAHPFSDIITCIGIGYDENHAYVLTRDALSPSLKWPQNVKWLYHNGSFDTQKIAKDLGVWLPIGHDTMLQSYSVDERSVRGLHKLKPLAREFVGASFYEEEEHDIEINPNALYTYNAKDVVYTWRLHNHLSKWQHDEGVEDYYTGILLPAQEMLAHSQYYGIYIDPEAVDEIEVTLGVEYLQRHVQLTQMAKQAGFASLNPNSPIQIKAILSSLGFKVKSTNKTVLNDLLDREDIPFITLLLRYRMLTKLIGTYLNNVRRFILSDGRVHPHAFLTGTVTGRLTYKDPPVQTLPKPKTVGELGIIRKIFSATNEDYILCEFDYAQIEAWVAAYLSEDSNLLADLQSGNWHTRVTQDVFGVTPSHPKWAFYYDGGKHLNYGSLYEEGPEGLTRRPPIGLGCDLKTAKAYHEKWHARYTQFDKWRRNIKTIARDEGRVVTPFGHVRRFPFIVNDHQLRQAVNAPIQSTAGHYTLTSAIRLWRKLEQLDSHLLFIEHDALYFEVNKTYQDEVFNLIKEVMETPPLPGLPSIKVEGDAGPNLAELTRIV